jgi:hypothetical protein
MPSARAAGTPAKVRTTSMLLRNASVVGDGLLRGRAVVAQDTTLTSVMTTSMLLNDVSVAGDNPRLRWGITPRWPRKV